jgi:hypothetical protein
MRATLRFGGLFLFLLVTPASAVPSAHRVDGHRTSGAFSGGGSNTCASLVSGDELMFRLHSEQTVSIDSVWAPLRAELDLQPWPADSLERVNDAVLCRRIDSLIVAWLSGPGAGRLVGVAGSIGPVAVMRIGTTVFHVKPGAALPVQPEPFRPYFVVDTAAPPRVAFWRATP